MRNSELWAGQSLTAAKGAQVAWAMFESAEGEMLAAVSEHGLAALLFGPEAFADLSARWRKLGLDLSHDPARCAPAIAALQAEAPTPLAPIGTAFQLQVWQAALSIPKGETRSYQEIATALGRPNASRAIGTAIGANPIALRIPCHRILRKSGALGGYAWGLARKERLLQQEGAKLARA